MREIPKSSHQASFGVKRTSQRVMKPFSSYDTKDAKDHRLCEVFNRAHTRTIVCAQVLKAVVEFVRIYKILVVVNKYVCCKIVKSFLMLADYLRKWQMLF